MKLLALKLCSLLVILAGVLAILVMIQSNLEPGQAVLGDCPLQPWIASGSVVMGGYAAANWYGGYVGWGIGVVLLLFGLYSLMPKVCGGTRTVVYPAEQGDVVIELKPVRKTMLRILKAMPEVKKIQRLEIKPDQERRLAVIEMDAVVHNDLNVPARVVYERINHAIVKTGNDMLGLELFLPINLRVKGVDLDSGSAGESIQRSQPMTASRAIAQPPTGPTSAEMASYASATAPAAPETPGELPATYEQSGQGWGQSALEGDVEPMASNDFDEDIPNAEEEDRRE